MLAGCQIVAVRAPAGAVEQTEVLKGELAQCAAAAFQQPQVVAAIAVRGEGDMAAVGAVLRLHVPGEACGQWRSGPAADGHFVEVAQQVKGNMLAIRRNVDAHPGAFAHINGGAGGRGREIGLVHAPCATVLSVGGRA